MQKIAVQKGLTPVKEYLADHGYDVETFEVNDHLETKNNNFDAIIVTGLNTNSLGINETATNAPIIDATGMTPEEIHEQLQQAFL
ncbi:MAG: YkuS family protein [Clostridiaceae bacterium]|jgi:galactitol-specific phosphotransferase system IIB component|nr:YkuS family protein [Clostridiaceae bacterium]